MQKSYELIADDENLLNTYKSDSIGRNKDILSFVNLLNGINGNCSIAVNGKWGSGKTFFIKQIAHIINSLNTFNKNKTLEEYRTVFNKENIKQYRNQIVIYYDAWQHDDEEDPILSLISSISEEVKITYDSKVNENIFNAVLESLNIITKMDISSIIKEVKSKGSFSIVDERKRLKQNVMAFLHELINEKADRLIIIVDELDRCCPTYAVKMFERIKHYFEDDRITFVFSTNLYELQNTIKKHYGENFNAIEYLNRFFDFIIDIPEVDINKYLSYINEKPNSKYLIDEYKKELIKKYNLSMREIVKYTRMLNIAVGNNLVENAFRTTEQTNYFIKLYVVPLMIILKFKDVDVYNDFLNGKNPNPLIEAMIDFGNDWTNSMMLSNNETFDNVYTNSPMNVKINKKERIRELYESIFIGFEKYTFDKYIGKIRIDSEKKNYVMDIANMLSNITSI